MESTDVRLQNLKPFQPGIATNPNGRGSSLNRSTTIKKWMDVKIPIEDLEGVMFTGTAEDKIILAMIRKAGAGDVAAAALLLDGRYGKQKTGIEVSAPEKEKFDASKYTDEELHQLQALMSKGYNSHIQDAEIITD